MTIGKDFKKFLRKYYPGKSYLKVSREGDTEKMRSSDRAFDINTECLKKLKEKGLLKKKYKKVLDIGTAVSLISHFLAIKFPDKEIVAVDNSKEMIEAAQKYKKRIEAKKGRKLENISHLVADGKKLPTKSDAFDLVLLFGVNEALYFNFYKEIPRVLKPDGVVAATEFDETRVNEDRHGFEKHGMEKMGSERMKSGKLRNIILPSWDGYLSFFRKKS